MIPLFQLALNQIWAFQKESFLRLMPACNLALPDIKTQGEAMTLTAKLAVLAADRLIDALNQEKG